MYKLRDKYWLKLFRVSAILVILFFLVFCIGEVEQYFFQSAIDAYIAENGKEPSREISDEMWKSANFKTLPLLAIVMFGFSFFLSRFWSSKKRNENT